MGDYAWASASQQVLARVQTISGLRSHVLAAYGTGGEQRRHDAACNRDYAGDHTHHSQRPSRKDGGELVGGKRVATPQSQLQVRIT